MPKAMCIRLFVAVFAALACASAYADFIWRIGDSVYVDGKRYSRDEWEKIQAGAPTKDGKAANAAPSPASERAVEQETPQLHAAACRTTRMYDEFPEASEKFACTENLGSLTREEILGQGWKIDLIEKLPAPTGAPGTSERGLPLNSYKLILSR